MSASAVSRRCWLALTGGGALAAGFVGPALGLSSSRVFNVIRKGSTIGTHQIDFGGDSGHLTVSNRIDLAVKIAFVTAYRYEQRGEDVWQSDVLVRTRIETNDDGEKSVVIAESSDGQLAVQGPKGSYATPLGAMTDLSFWNDAITGAPPLIDSQTGELIRMAVQTDTTEVVQVLGQPVEARRYEMAATKGRSGTVWYDSTARLVKAVVVTRGETLNYELAA